MESSCSTGENGLISIESTAEWQIHDIGFDGQERYIEPLSFSDHVSKLSNSIDWRKLTDDQSIIRDNPSLIDNEKLGAETETIKDKQEGVGPWQGVANSLHQSLTQINVLLDVLNVAKTGKYLTVDHVVDQGDNDDMNKQHTQRAAKRKALTNMSESLCLLSERIKSQRRESDLDKFVVELSELRESWRVKKVANLILGDLGYVTYGTKFKPNSTFEVRKLSPPVNGSCLDVKIPKDLQTNYTICVEIEKADSPSLLVASSPFCSSNCPQISSWQDRLIAAQQTLVAKEMFAQLSRDAVALDAYFSVVKDNVIIVSLGQQGFVIKIQLVNDNYKHKGIELLVSQLHSDLRSDLSLSNSCCVQSLTSLPLSSTNYNNKIPSGAAANNKRQSTITQRPSLLNRLIEKTKHYIICKQIQTILKHFAAECQFTNLTWHWCLTGSKYSVIQVQLANCQYEAYNKTHLEIKIATESLILCGKDGQSVKLDVNTFNDTLWEQTSIHLLSLVSQIIKCSRWEIVDCCVRAGEDYRNTPTLAATNINANREIIFEFPFKSQPRIRIYKIDIEKSNKNEERRQEFVINYANLVGKGFVQRIQLLLSAIQN